MGKRVPVAGPMVCLRRPADSTTGTAAGDQRIMATPELLAPRQPPLWGLE
ncbi:MAG: hypothetical protein HY444_03705 [Nitrospirae bacterium]|nr:hypothetical protein [Nitrospirota bacterium]